MSPQRRILLVQPRRHTDPRLVEVLLLGEPEDIAPMVATVGHAISLARGLDCVQPLVMGTQQIGYTARRNNTATYHSPIDEVHHELQGHVPVGLITWDVDVDEGIMGGTW